VSRFLICTLPVTSHARWLLALLFIGLLTLVFPSAARAQAPAEFIVNSTVDQVDADIVDDLCDADPGPEVRCTLRAALMQANVTPGQQIIKLQPQIYRLTIAGANEDSSAKGDLDIRQTVQIIGAVFGKLRSTIDATGLGDRALHNIADDVRLQNLTITGGTLPSTTISGNPFCGGGIRNSGKLTISDSLIRNNTAAHGGGIYHTAGTLTVERTTIGDNHATATDASNTAEGGGGILATSSLLVRDSSVENNTSQSLGGGLSLFPGMVGESLQIERSLIVGNSAEVGGGGVHVDGTNIASIVINNSTLSANHAGHAGGGISGLNLMGGVALRASTIAGNSAVSGGGIRLEEVEATNVIFANNSDSNCIFSDFSNSSFNLSTDSSCVFDGSNNISSASAGLTALAFNGGPTRTHALLPGSPAIDAGTFPLPLAVLFDQRGALRIPPGQPGGNPHDIGAFEFNAAGVGTFALTPVTANTTANQTTTLTLIWTHPARWRDLSTVDLQLRHQETMPLWVRLTEGLTKTQGISMTNGLALYDSDGTLAGVGEPGQARVLESDRALVDLAHSQVQGSGPEGKDVRLTLAVRLKDAAAGKVYTVTLLASDDAGALQGPNNAGTLTVGPFRMFVPLTLR
jgi:hypothetical protein